MIEYSTIAPYLFVDDAPAVEEFMKNKATLTKINNKEFVLDVASIGTYRLQSRQQAIAMILSLLDGVTYTRQGRVSFESGDKYMCMVKGAVGTRKRTRAEVGGQSEMMGVGWRVSAAYPDGFMYPATIVKVNRIARTYKVRWDDADEAHQLVKMDDVEPLTPAEDAVATAAATAAAAAEDARDGERVGTILRTTEEDELLFLMQEKLQRSEGELQRSEGELQRTQGELQRTQGELQRTQGELKQCRAELQRSEGDLMITQEEVLRCHVVMVKTEEELKKTQGERQRSDGDADLRRTVEELNEKLRLAEGQIRTYLVEIELSHEELERAREEIGRAVVCETTLQVKLSAAVSASQIARNDTKRVQKDMKGLLVKTSEMRVEMESATALARDAAARSDRMAQERLAFCAKVEALEAALRDLRGTLSPAEPA